MNQKTNTPNKTPENALKQVETSANKAMVSDKPAKGDTPKGDASKATPNNNKSTANQPESKKTESSKAQPSKSEPSKPAAKSGSGKGLQYVFLLLIVGLIVAIWFAHDQTTQKIVSLENRLQQQQDQNVLSTSQSQQALDALKKQNDKIEELNKAIIQSKNDFNSLNKSFQLVADRGSDLILLNDIEHLATIAQQQLHLSGNVANAIISLETAQAQLSIASKPEFASLQQTINGDLERLRTAATVDVSLLSASLDELAGLVLQAPLLVPDYAVPELESKLNKNGTSNNGDTVPNTETNPTETESGDWWQNWASKAWNWSVDTASTIKYDLNQFVSVRRVDDASALLISPDQAARFRDNLRLRIMTAQLALMMGHSQIWHTETTAVLDAIQTRFDKDSGITRKAIKIARQVADAEIDVKIPSVNNTVNAIKTIRESDLDRLNAPQQ